MSELKAHDLVDIQDYRGEVYLKYEADKVIAELKDDCAYWKMSEGNAANAMHETEEYAMQLYKELRHQKYKRCLVMAWWCHSMWILLRDENETKRSVFYWRWWNIWLELAEKLKEAK